jgi:hypothetical protein
MKRNVQGEHQPEREKQRINTPKRREHIHGTDAEEKRKRENEQEQIEKHTEKDVAEK